MSENGNDIYARLNVFIDDWSTQLSRSHEELSAQIGSARSHLDRLLESGGPALTGAD